MSSLEIRLVSTEYRNRIVYEEGPGSTQDIVSDSRSWWQAVGKMTLAQARSLTMSDLEDWGFYFDEDSYDGFEEYSYKLEYLDPATDKWRLVQFLPRK